MSDDIDDFIEKMKRFFNFNSDIVDMDFFLFPTGNPEVNFNPDETKSKAFKVSYHYDSSMDQPEIKIEGDIDDNKLNDYLKNLNLDKHPQFKKLGLTPQTGTLDASELSLEPFKKETVINELDPYTEINDFENFSEILLELSGIEEKDISLNINEDGDRLTIIADDSIRRYYKSIELPFKTSLDDIHLDFNNGIAIVKVMRQI